LHYLGCTALISFAKLSFERGEPQTIYVYVLKGAFKVCGLKLRPGVVMFVYTIARHILNFVRLPLLNHFSSHKFGERFLNNQINNQSYFVTKSKKITITNFQNHAPNFWNFN
jgi:hypothetical protein